jgi:hypothetical protein
VHGHRTQTAERHGAGLVEHDLAHERRLVEQAARAHEHAALRSSASDRWNANGTAMPIAHGHVITSTEIATGSARAASMNAHKPPPSAAASSTPAA